MSVSLCLCLSLSFLLSFHEHHSLSALLRFHEKGELPSTRTRPSSGSTPLSPTPLRLLRCRFDSGLGSIKELAGLSSSSVQPLVVSSPEETRMSLLSDNRLAKSLENRQSARSVTEPWHPK
ncbi:hypothetical protein RchiOBHm_Chr6g0263801 [Rosa chinensis]|uniref:Secreted protein n=1 Tax=Rosa chinensis TaxID=74649 RepID=A0A2P6PP00_ROSCH|nr:hypothetical protein RchiOBHm_Chr6g0263801 [Rosa chinensis]